MSELRIELLQRIAELFDEDGQIICRDTEVLLQPHAFLDDDKLYRISIEVEE